MTRKIKGAFAGGGMYMFLHAGAYKAMTEAGFEFEEVAGTSAGAYISSAIASGMSPEAVENLVFSFIPFQQNLFDASLSPAGFGLIKGKKIENVLKDYLPKTFAETKIPLAVFTANIDQQRVDEWSTRKTPNAPVTNRVVCSGRIPGIFKAERIDGDDHSDGGSANNFPIDYWSDLKANGEVVDDSNVYGFKFDETVSGPLPPRKAAWRFFSNMFRYFTGQVGLMMSTLTNEHIADALWARTITLSAPDALVEAGISGNSFDMNEDQARTLIKAGYDQTVAWLEKWDTNV
jgi:predicted acylesterase/phospholipase RssA